MRNPNYRVKFEELSKTSFKEAIDSMLRRHDNTEWISDDYTKEELDQIVKNKRNNIHQLEQKTQIRDFYRKITTPKSEEELEAEAHETKEHFGDFLYSAHEIIPLERYFTTYEEVEEKNPDNVLEDGGIIEKIRECEVQQFYEIVSRSFDMREIKDLISGANVHVAEWDDSPVFIRTV